MQYYRCKIRSMDENQKEQLKTFCSALGINAEITPIKPVGQPSKIDEEEFKAYHIRYIKGEIKPMDIMLKFDLSKSGFYNKLKKLNLPDKKTYMDANKVANQQPIQQVPCIEEIFGQGFGVDSFGIYGDSLEQETHIVAESQETYSEDDYGLELYKDDELELEDDI